MHAWYGAFNAVPPGQAGYLCAVSLGHVSSRIDDALDECGRHTRSNLHICTAEGYGVAGQYVPRNDLTWLAMISRIEPLAQAGIAHPPYCMMSSASRQQEQQLTAS